jgi:hypothetical protein
LQPAAAVAYLFFDSQRLLQTVPQRGVGSPQLVHGVFGGVLLVVRAGVLAWGGPAKDWRLHEC